MNLPPNAFDEGPHASDYFISSEARLLNFDYTINLLLGAPWNDCYSRDQLLDALKSSINFGVYYHAGAGKADVQVGFGRVVSDFATFHYLMDVVIDEKHRHKGLGKFLCAHIFSQHQFQRGIFLLRTKTAAKMYSHFGFEPCDAMKLIPGKCTSSKQRKN